MSETREPEKVEPKLKHGFIYDGSGRIPDYLLICITETEWRKRVSEMTVPKYWEWKLKLLINVIQDMVDGGMSQLSHEANNRLVYRLKAKDETQKDLDTIQKDC